MKLSELKDRVCQKLVGRLKANRAEMTPPRYDGVFYRGIAELWGELANNPNWERVDRQSIGWIDWRKLGE